VAKNLLDLLLVETEFRAGADAAVVSGPGVFVNASAS